MGDRLDSQGRRLPRWSERTTRARICVVLWHLWMIPMTVGPLLLLVNGHEGWALPALVVGFAVWLVISGVSGEFPWFPEGVPDGMVEQHSLNSPHGRARRNL